MNNNKGVLLLLLFVCLQICMMAQITKPITKPKADTTREKFSIAPLPVIGYISQGFNTLELGVKPMYFTSKKRPAENASVIAGCYLFQSKTYYFAPYATGKYYLQFGKSRFGLNLSGTYWIARVEKMQEQLITPEVGLAFFIFSISYGYNYPITHEQIPFIAQQRIAFRIIVL